MKNLFNRKNQSLEVSVLENQGEFQPTVDNTQELQVKQNSMPKFENPPTIPEKPASMEIQDKKTEVKIWKCYRASSCSDVTGFLNDSGIDPAFMIPGTNGQINIFYKG